MILATTAATTTGPKLSIAIEPSTISVTKNAPAIGALYADVMPAAAPHATSKRSRGGSKWTQRPISEAASAASWTIGPSRPIEPPLEIVNSDERLRHRLSFTGTTPSPIATASM